VDETKFIYPEGMECSWLAMDGHGRVAAFVTAGSGPIPEVLFQDPALAPEDIESRIAELGIVSSAQMQMKLKTPDYYLAVAQRGLYVFDWSDATRTRNASTGKYDLIAWPDAPIGLSGLTPELRSIAHSAVIASIDFSSRESLDVREHLRCLSGKDVGSP